MTEAMIVVAAFVAVMFLWSLLRAGAQPVPPKEKN